MSFLDEFLDLNLDYRSGSPWALDSFPPVCSPVPSVCGGTYYDEESNGPFIGRADPLLSSSAPNLTTLALETEKQPVEKEMLSFHAAGAPAAPPPPPSLAQLKREDHFSLYTSSLRAPFQASEMAPAPVAASTLRQETISRSPFAFQIATNSMSSTPIMDRMDRSLPVLRVIPKSTFGSLPSRDVRGGVPISESSPPPPLPTRVPSHRHGGGGKKRSARLSSLRASSMSSLYSENDGTASKWGDSGNSDEEGEEDDDDDFDATRCLDEAALDRSQAPPRKRGRRKEGIDDFSPSPARLSAINQKLEKLNETMARMTPVTEVPAHAKNKCRKERNKLASRACRLKKKASFEANKVKLHGLEEEHDRLFVALNTLKQEIENRKRNLASVAAAGSSMVNLWNKIAKPALDFRVAGRMTEYVVEVLDQVKDLDKIDNGSEVSD